METRTGPPLEGHVVALWRYVVKSLGGERCETLALDPRGVVGDRAWGLVDPDGGIASGKTTRRFRKVPGLLRHSASLGADGRPRVRLADGRVVGPTDAVAEELAGPGWRFAPEGRISYVDAAPVHVVTTATLRSLGAASGTPVEPERLRPNILIEIDGDGPLEDDWTGRRLRIGGAVLTVTDTTERCVMVGHSQVALTARPQLLRQIGRWNNACAGVYAEVDQPGQLHVGDRVCVDPPPAAD